MDGSLRTRFLMEPTRTLWRSSCRGSKTNRSRGVSERHTAEDAAIATEVEKNLKAIESCQGILFREGALFLSFFLRLRSYFYRARLSRSKCFRNWGVWGTSCLHGYTPIAIGIHAFTLAWRAGAKTPDFT